MNRFAELLASTAARPALVVHLGAGSCKEYELYRSLDTSKVIFIEPDRQLAEQAYDKFGNQPFVKVIEQAISTENGTRFLNITNNPRFSSLLAPAGLLDFYPNIEITDSVEVETITLEHLCLSEDIDGNMDNLLVAELQGLEPEVFSSASKSALNKFKWIVISSSKQNLYQSGSSETQNDLRRVMQDKGYTVLSFMENTPPFATSILCLRNEAIAENMLLKQRMTDLDNSLAKLKRQVSEQKSCFAKQENTYGEKIAVLKKAWLSKSSALQLKSDELATTSAKLKSVSSDLNTKTNKLKVNSDELAAKSGELTAKTNELTAKSEELEEALNQIQSINTEKEKLSQKAERDAKELAEMQQTLRINNKLMLKSEADLSDLQNQHRIALQLQEQQHSLLCELKEKLGQASQFYRKLNIQNLVLDGDMSDQNNSGEVDSLDSDGT